MINTKLQFGRELLRLILQGHSSEEVGGWAYKVYLNWPNCDDVEFLDLLIELSTMELGVEFVISREELRKIAINLMSQNDLLKR